MDKKKMLVGLSTTAIILLSLLAPMLVARPVVAETAADYNTVKGVLDSDYYVLYPFEKNSLTIGFSKYGEFINPFTGDGLNYSGRDPFANEGVDMKYWLNGWFLDLRYVHRTYGARRIWAMAMFADMANYGGDWLNEHPDPYGAPYGGRKCSAVATTEPISVLYDGPRLFVAKLVTHIKDKHGALTWPVVDVIFTIIFEKVKKQVIVFKDIKLTIDAKILDSPVNVQFSNRGEWDLGPSPDWKSYAHFFHQEFPTCYDASWHLQKVITREYKYYNASFTGMTINLDTETASEPDYDVPVALHSEYVYVNNVWTKRGVDYTINYTTGVITFNQSLSKAKVEIYFKLHKVDKNERPIALPHLYDVAQIISRDKKVVGYAAFWPVLSDYTVDGWDYCLEPLYNIGMADMESEPDIPFVIGEWDFLLDYDPLTTPNWGEQFRGVTVYGIVNYHDAEDKNADDDDNALDREIVYQLDEVFNPWDLNDAVHKETKRWVEFFTGDGTWNAKTLKYRPVVGRRLGAWYGYCSFAERVLVDGVLLTPIDALLPNWWPSFPYTYYIIVDGYGEATIIFLKDTDGKMSTLYDLSDWKVEKGKVVKVLYSTLPKITDSHYSEIKIYKTLNNITVNVPISITVPGIYDEWNDALGVTHDIYLDIEALNITLLTTGKNWTGTFELDEPLIFESDFKVFVGETHYTTVIDVYPPISVSIGDGNATLYLDVGSLTKSISDAHYPGVIWPLDRETVHVDYLSCYLYVEINVEFTTYPDGSNETTVDGYISVGSYYTESLGGRYEWTIVGRDAHTVDSAGASLVTAAFKNKQVEIGLAGADMMETTIANAMPWVMRKFGTGNMVADYKDMIGRAALNDDWCTTWPVASSNMIGVGGPLANLLAYYANDFTPALYGIEAYACSAWDNKIIALSCWNKNKYASNATVGYAVVSTYKDLNGTVIFLVWGHWGRDTYYATKWFHEEGVYQLQKAPECATALILKIDYTKHEPTVSVVEVLGTISETLWTHGTLKKGGIHPDP